VLLGCLLVSVQVGVEGGFKGPVGAIG